MVVVVRMKRAPGSATRRHSARIASISSAGTCSSTRVEQMKSTLRASKLVARRAVFILPNQQCLPGRDCSRESLWTL